MLPPHPEAGPVSIRLTDSNGPVARGALRFLYLPPASPRVASPHMLASDTPASVTVTGVNMSPAGGGLRCRVGAGRGGGAAPVRFLSSTAVVCAVPGQRAGNVSVAVANDAEAFAPVPVPLQVLPSLLNPRACTLNPNP